MLHHKLYTFVGTMLLAVILLYPSAPSWAKGRLYPNTNILLESCLQRCEEQTSLASLTREGCYTGCAQIRRAFTLRSSYRSVASCIEDMNDLELERDIIIADNQAWCNRQWPHLHKRKGCKDAMEAYIRSATVGSICYNQAPQAIARQTPRSTITSSMPPVTTYQHSARPSPRGSTQHDMGYGLPQGHILSQPPVYDTPQYRQTPARRSTPNPINSARTVKKGATAPQTSSTPKAAPSLVPPKKTTAASASSPSSARKAPVVTPSTAIGTSPAKGNLPSASTTPATSGASATTVTGSPTTQQAVAPSAPTTPTTATQGTPPPPHGAVNQNTQTAAVTPLAPNTEQETVLSPTLPTPVRSPATAPTAPPVIAPPSPIFSSFGESPSPAVTATAPPPTPATSTAEQRPGLLPVLQPSPAPQGQKSDGVLPPPMPAPMPISSQ